MNTWEAALPDSKNNTRLERGTSRVRFRQILGQETWILDETLETATFWNVMVVPSPRVIE